MLVPLVQGVDILRRIPSNRLDVSDEQHSLRILVPGVEMSNRVIDDVVAPSLGEPVVDWEKKHSVVDPFVWDVQLVHDSAGVGITEKVTSNEII